MKVKFRLPAKERILADNTSESFDRGSPLTAGAGTTEANSSGLVSSTSGASHSVLPADPDDLFLSKRTWS